MNRFPSRIAGAVPVPERHQVEAWWAGLSEVQRDELTTLWDERREASFFDAGPDGEQPPAVIGGRFVPPDDAWGLSEWGPEWLDHLLEHPEVRLVDQIRRPTFHICRAHAAAREVLSAGRIPAGFRCPFASDECPMRRLLAVEPGSDLVLVPLTRRASGRRGTPAR